MSIDVVAEFDRVTARELLDIVEANGETYRRIRATCCSDSGLWPAELDMHAAAITRVVNQARQEAKQCV